ncbi:MAG TPA: bifunctional diaminohydroxyphosphoribosylaminopyrimidine deaminase/5-amino-6-(5-phosphoribosylamino)uracil reductase RibD, partial [Candidatus Caenarcaniphilales bacterium]|nr:bifunctional diaminohydroxyphosphoribosylaminopyrimidine deaminase/5-amino-6-(5-phosphoribosylamino)uracil reductase RibD [Candidatus Caenarcaniphilales bacterium]
MARALELAEGVLGRTAPNPPVGAVVVLDGEVVGEGAHVGAGSPHAETVALAAAGSRARGATLYVTLGPCCHHGRTPPCVETILAAGIREVRYPLDDPDPRVAGAGRRALEAAG